MIITRKKHIPRHWLFYVQLPLVLSIYSNFVLNTPFLLMMKRFIDNPAAIMGLISIEFWVTWMGGPLVAWLSDRIWTRFGRRKFFFAIADGSKAFLYLLMPFAPNLWTLIIIRWIIGAVGDFGAMTQALIYETVPPPQRGKASGVFSSCIQFGNLIFYFLLLGRFNDVYFMGPFKHLTELNGGTMMFYLLSFMLMGVALFEAVGFKEIRPPNQRLLKDEIKPGQNIFIYFATNFFKDILAKDFLPLYLFMFINVMFGVGLGIFQPLLFTEQWGYSLQDMGNTIAVGVATTVTFSLISGWFADKYGKLKTFLIATIMSFCVNIFYTVYVYNQPDFRPSLLEIILIGNVIAAIGMVKGVVTYPLMMEYVRRDRMGAANAGMGLFGSGIRNLVTLGVGGWLLGWSIWFFPQAGYFVETTFAEEKSKQEVEELLVTANLDSESFILRPVHQYGVDGDLSKRWWIHRSDELTQDMLKERKDLNNELAPLKAKLDNPLLDDDKKTEITQTVEEIESRLEDIKSSLSEGVAQVESDLLPALKQDTFRSGDQLIETSFENNTVILHVDTIERLKEDQREKFRKILDGPQFAKLEKTREVEVKKSFWASLFEAEEMETQVFWESDVEVELPPGEDASLRFKAAIDPNFSYVFEMLVKNGIPSEHAFSFANSLTSIFRIELGNKPNAYEISDLTVTVLNPVVEPGAEVEDETTDPETEKEKISFSFLVTLEEETEWEFLAGMLSDEKVISSAEFEADSNQHAAFVVVRDAFEPLEEDSLRQKRLKALQPVFAEKISGPSWKAAFLAESYLRVTDALASEPFYVTVPESTPRADFKDREYEYFFAIQTLQISTDIIGFAIIWFLLLMEKKGVVHRAGAEEDEER